MYELIIDLSIFMLKRAWRSTMKKAVFFDIDGTLVAYDGTIPDSTILALKKLREKGHLAVISTGRTKPLIMPELLELGFDGIVAGCGSYVEYDGKEVYSGVADIEWVMAISQRLGAEGLSPFLESPVGLYYFPELVGEREKATAEYYRKLLCGKYMSVCDDMKVSKMYVPLYGRAFNIEDYSEFSEYFDILVHGDVAVELVPRIYNKATGMEHFIKAVGIEREDTYAIGDSLNDAQMLSFAGTGIVMGGAFEEVKKYADYITTDIKDDGIYNALKHFKLID